MDQSSQLFEVQLLGQRLTLKASAVDPELVPAVIHLVSTKLDELQKRTPLGTLPVHIALLSLLEVAEEYLQAKKRTMEFKEQIDQKSSEFLSLIDTECP